jgi:hypothetical protein
MCEGMCLAEEEQEQEEKGERNICFQWWGAAQVKWIV